MQTGLEWILVESARIWSESEWTRVRTESGLISMLQLRNKVKSCRLSECQSWGCFGWCKVKASNARIWLGNNRAGQKRPVKLSKREGRVVRLSQEQPWENAHSNEPQRPRTRQCFEITLGLEQRTVIILRERTVLQTRDSYLTTNSGAEPHWAFELDHQVRCDCSRVRKVALKPAQLILMLATRAANSQLAADPPTQHNRATRTRIAGVVRGSTKEGRLLLRTTTQTRPTSSQLPGVASPSLATVRGG